MLVAANIPDAYLVAALPVLLVSLIGIMTWLVRGQGRHDTSLANQAVKSDAQDVELADHEVRLRAVERRRIR